METDCCSVGATICYSLICLCSLKRWREDRLFYFCCVNYIKYLMLSLSKVSACLCAKCEYGSAGITSSVSDPFLRPVLCNKGGVCEEGSRSVISPLPASGRRLVTYSLCVEVCVTKDKLLLAFEQDCVVWWMKPGGFDRLPRRLGRWMSTVF